jgi:hypothetical protein
MVIAAAVVPHPPVLVPEIAQGLAPDLEELRSACDTAIDRLYRAGPDEIVIVGAGPRRSANVAGIGSFREYGLDLPVDGRWEAATEAADGATEPMTLPMTLPFLIAAWLLRDRPGTPSRRAVMVEGSGPEAGAADLAAGSGRRQALLVLGDGSASRSLQAPGHFDERAEPYDRAVAEALAAADTKALTAIDTELSRQLRVAGLAAWRTLAAAADESGFEYEAELLYDDAPYGVGYFVASWVAR